MANPFYIEPASMLPGFTSFLSGIESRADYEREKTKKAKQETIRKQAAGLAQSGNTDELYKLTLENPWLTDEVTKASKWHNEELKTDAIESARRVLMGESPGQVGIEHAEKVIQAGGDATKQIEQIKQDQLAPEAAIKRAEMFLLFHDPQTYKALKESQKTEGPKQQIVNGQLVTITPEGAKASQIEGLQGLDAPKSDYDRWKQNPAEFAQFRAAGREPRESSPDAAINFTPAAIENAAARYNMDGTLPPMGMGTRGAAGRTAILNKAAELAAGISGPEQRAKQIEAKAIAESIKQQEKQYGSMGSFVKNLGAQVDKVEEISKDISTYDTRLLNVPLRAFRQKIAGNPNQAKYDMYLTEIESEIGKLATGSTGSVAELSASAQERWAKIHDKNLSVKDMLSLLKETKTAGEMRLKSVKDNLDETKSRLRPTANTPIGVGMPSPPGAVRKQVNRATGAIRYLDKNGNVLQ
jgi:hypothetical protein